VDPRGHYSNPPSRGKPVIGRGVLRTDLVALSFPEAIVELYDRVFGALHHRRTMSDRRGRRHPSVSKQVQRRISPHEVEKLVASYLAGATVLELASTHQINRTTVLAHLERHKVTRRGHVQVSDFVNQAVTLYGSGRSCASIGKELHVSPETARQALIKVGVQIRKPGRPRTAKDP
jgi:hypothetical protein